MADQSERAATQEASMSEDLRELAKAVEAAASSAQSSDHWAGFYALKVGPAGNVYEEVSELGSVSVVIDDLLTDLDARDAEIKRLRHDLVQVLGQARCAQNNGDVNARLLHSIADAVNGALNARTALQGGDDEG